MPADPYVYPGASCLRNRLGIRDPGELALVEAEQTSILIVQLELKRLPGRYDLAHLTAFHRRIFGDIYEWAGELRSVAIAKDDSVFALPEHIDSYLAGCSARSRVRTRRAPRHRRAALVSLRPRARPPRRPARQHRRRLDPSPRVRRGDGGVRPGRRRDRTHL